MEITLAVLAVLSLPIFAIAGLVTAIGARDCVRTSGQRFADFQPARAADSTAAAPAAILAEPLPPPQAAAAPA